MSQAVRCPSCELLTMTRMKDGSGHCTTCGRTIDAETLSTEIELANVGRKPKPRKFPPVVYFIQWGDRIKIGTSENIRERLVHLYHDEVLALEPGDRAQERRRHNQFASHKIKKYNEWFEAAPEILELTANLRNRYPQLMKDL